MLTQSPISDSLSLRLLPLTGLTSQHTSNSPVHYAKGTRSDYSGFAEANPFILPQLVGTRFQVLFHSPSGVLFTFPSRYSFTIGHQLVFSLSPWSGQIPTGFHLTRGTWVPEPRSPSPFAYGTIALCGKSFQNFSARVRICHSPVILRHHPFRSRYPNCTTHAGFNVQIGLGSFHFARRY
jgi:hypothetical protein